MPSSDENEPKGRAVISVDASCSGKKAACAAVLSVDGHIVAERSEYLRKFDGYVLTAELAAVSLASELAREFPGDGIITIEVDNPDVPRVILEGYRPRQASRIPANILASAAELGRLARIALRVLPRNSTPGLRRADRLAKARLWRKKKTQQLKS